MKRMIRKWLGIDSEPTPPLVDARDVLSGAEMAFVAYRIDNGYLLRIGSGLTLQNTIVYCTDEKDMAEKIVVHRTKMKITGSPSVIGAKAGYQANNLTTKY